MKRLAKILLAGLLLIVLALVGLFFYVKIKYPPERLKAILISRLARDFGIRVTIERLNFNLFSGFEVEKLKALEAAKENQNLPEAFRSPLVVEKVTFAYRWRSLLARQLDIDEIIIEQSSLFYWQAPDSSSNFDALLAAFADTTAAARDTSVVSLPITINLKTFSLRDLRIKAAMASAVDTQYVEVGPIHTEVGDIEVDRQANYRAKFKVESDPAHLSYAVTPVGQGDSFRFTSQLQSRFDGSVNSDSAAVHAELALKRSTVSLNDSPYASLPTISTNAQISFNFASSQLLIPEINFMLDGIEQFAARFTMDQHGRFECHINRGGLDLDRLNRIVQSCASAGLLPDFKNLNFGGYLDFSNSAVYGDSSGVQYDLELRGRDLAYTDLSTGLKIDHGELQVDWRPTPDASESGSTALAGKLNFATFEVPLDTQSVLKSGPGALEIKLALSKDFLPQQGDLKFNWQRFSEGTLSGYAAIRPASNSRNNTTWFSNLRGEAEIVVDSVELSPLTAGMLKGKLAGEITLKGNRLDALQLNCDLRNAMLAYDDGVEYKGKIPPDHLLATAMMALNPELTQLAFNNGTLKCRLGAASFRAAYEIEKETLRFDIAEATLDLSQVFKVLPDTFFTDWGPLLVAGAAPTEGWLEIKFVAPDSFDYSGFFKAHAENAIYHDSTLGIYAEQLKIDSEWWVTTNTTTGKYSLFCPAPRFPDYLPTSLPATTAWGKIFVDEQTFTINEGKFDIPAWRVDGAYRVDGEFRPTGLQVKTTTDLELNTNESIALSPGVALKGKLKTAFQLDQFLPNTPEDPQPANLTGGLQANGVHVVIDTLLALRDLNADVSFAQDFDLLDASLKPSTKRSAAPLANAGEVLLLYDIFGEAIHEQSNKPSRLTIAQLQLLGYQISDIQADLIVGDCRFDIPQLRMNLFGGNMIGNLLIDLGDGNPDQIRYSTALQISSIDVSRFRRLGAQVEKGSKLSADFSLSGVGTSPEKLQEVANNLAGRLNITKIEKKVASNLLEALDPNGTDAGIQRMRSLLKAGWNVRSITFEVKNGFVYAALAPVKTKPWSALFTLPPTLDFARLPLRYFLETSSTE